MKKIIGNLITPFDKEYRIDENNLIKIIDLMKENFVDEISLFSLSAETLNLLREDKEKIYKIVKENWNKKIVINIFTSDIKKGNEEIKKINKEDIIYLHLPYLYKLDKEGIILFYEKILNDNPSNKFYLEVNDLSLKDIKKLLKNENVLNVVSNDLFYVYNGKEILNRIIIENDNLISKGISLNVNKYISDIAFAYGKIINEMILDKQIEFKNVLLYSYLDLVNEVFNELPSPINIKYYLYLKNFNDILNFKLPFFFNSKKINHFDLLI